MFFSEKLLLKRVLIANRGEIACRIHRSWIKLKIEPVGVYSKANENALHVSLVDKSVELTSKDALSGYLDADLLIATVSRLKCDAIHPGDDVEFVKKCEQANLKFIGPKHENSSTPR